MEFWVSTGYTYRIAGIGANLFFGEETRDTVVSDKAYGRDVDYWD